MRIGLSGRDTAAFACRRPPRARVSACPKYNENCVFYRKIARMALKTESYFSALERKFVTPRINGIFHGINEFKPP
jgi:hypothetical protein